MRKSFKLISFYLVIMFAFIFPVFAVSSSIGNKNSDNTYTFTWNGVDKYDECKIKLENATLSDSGDTHGGYLSKASGSVKIRSSVTNGVIVAIIYKDDVGNPVVTKAEKTIGNPTTAPATTTAQTPAPTTAQSAAKSNNANLKTIDIKTSDGDKVTLSPSFSPSVTEYTATVESTVKTISIEATMEDSKATALLSNNASDELVAGENNKITITVTAEDGTKKVYTLNISREALTADATLKKLIINEAKSFKLKDNTFVYDVKVAKDIKKLTLEIETSDENSEYKVEGNKNLKDGSVVKITVTAPDGTKKIYKLNIIKKTTATTKKVVVKAEKNPLIIMGLSIVAFGLIGGIIYVIKK